MAKVCKVFQLRENRQNFNYIFSLKLFLYSGASYFVFNPFKDAVQTLNYLKYESIIPVTNDGKWINIEFSQQAFQRCY